MASQIPGGAFGYQRYIANTQLRKKLSNTDSSSQSDATSPSLLDKPLQQSESRQEENSVGSGFYDTNSNASSTSSYAGFHSDDGSYYETDNSKFTAVSNMEDSRTRASGVTDNYTRASGVTDNYTRASTVTDNYTRASTVKDNYTRGSEMMDKYTVATKTAYSYYSQTTYDSGDSGTETRSASGRTTISINRVHELIEDGDWSTLVKVMATPQGKVMVSTPHANAGGDFALHLLCDYNFSISEREKFFAMLLHKKKKKEAREDRMNRRRKGEDIDSDYDSDEWTSSDESSVDTKNDGVGERTMPPASLILTVLKACPEAARRRGFLGRLPLHHAVMLDHPTEVIEALIAAYPEGLQVTDAHKKSPRDYNENTDNEHAKTNALIERPVSCWLQSIKDEDISRNMEKELESLEKEVGQLIEEHDAAIAEEKRMENIMAETAKNIEKFEKIRASEKLEERAEKLQKSIGTEMKVLTTQLEGMVGLTELKYADDDEERKYIAAFNDDVTKVYEDANYQMDEIKIRLQKLKDITKNLQA